jgi:site-specific recombinase XerD
MWLERKSQLGLGRAKHVFTTLKGEPLEGAYLREVCARKGAAAGITWRLHPHALRHSFAVDLLEHTGNLAMVQDALGHRDPRTTRIYAKVRNSSLARAMARRKQLAQPDRQALTDRLADLQRQIAELQEQIGGDER